MNNQGKDWLRRLTWKNTGGELITKEQTKSIASTKKVWEHACDTEENEPLPIDDGFFVSTHILLGFCNTEHMVNSAIDITRH